MRIRPRRARQPAPADSPTASLGPWPAAASGPRFDETEQAHGPEEVETVGVRPSPVRSWFLISSSILSAWRLESRWSGSRERVQSPPTVGVSRRHAPAAWPHLPPKVAWPAAIQPAPYPHKTGILQFGGDLEDLVNLSRVARSVLLQNLQPTPETEDGEPASSPGVVVRTGGIIGDRPGASARKAPRTFSVSPRCRWTSPQDRSTWASSGPLGTVPRSLVRRALIPESKARSPARRASNSCLRNKVSI